jgi:hypothetical protein
VRPLRIEYPEWVRNFHPEDWREPDEFEKSMGNIPDDCRVIHARRRWGAARHEWFRRNPAAAEQRFDEIVNGYVL